MSKLSDIINRRGDTFYHGNARPHTDVIIPQMVQGSDWKVLPRHPYSPELVPTDYYLFRVLKCSCNKENL